MDNKKLNTSQFKIPKTLSESIYEHLKESIIHKVIEPHQRINEQEIANRLQVSRTPVREAVARLVAEGFIEIISHREAIVKEVSYKELKDIFQVIGVLDKLAASIIIDHIDHQELTDLGKMTSKMERYFIMSEVEKFLDLNYAFHEKLWGYLNEKNKFLRNELYSCANRARMCYNPLIQIFKNPKILKKSMNSHKEMIVALKEKNAAKFEEVVLKHWIPPLP